MNNKAEAHVHLQHFIKFVEVQFDTSVKNVRSDNGMEFSMPVF